MRLLLVMPAGEKRDKMVEDLVTEGHEIVFADDWCGQSRCAGPIIALGGGNKVTLENIRNLLEYGRKVCLCDDDCCTDFPQEITGAWIDETAEIPKEVFMEFEIPERVDEGWGIPYRDKKVMHPWSRRKKR